MSNGGDEKRIVQYKRIVDPSDPSPENPTNWIDVPCITQIDFLSPDGQLFVRKFDSTAKNTLRKTHVFTVKSITKSGGEDDSNKIDVERIDEIQVQNGDWYEYLRFSNDDDNPSQVRKTHVLRYNQANKNDKNETPWVDIAVTDEFTIKGFLKQTHSFDLGSTDASQINIYALKNDPGQPLGDDDDPKDPKWGDNKFYGADVGWLPLDTNGNPDPVRLDPFQNIVNINWGSKLYLYLEINLVNQRFGRGGPNPVASVPAPTLNVTFAKAVKRLDEYHDPNGNQIFTGFFGCMTYIPIQTAVVGFGPQVPNSAPGHPSLPWSAPIFGTVGQDPQTAYDMWSSGALSAYVHVNAPVGQSCPLSPTQTEVASESVWSATDSYEETWYDQLAVIPVNYSSSYPIMVEYLLGIPAADGIVTVTVGGLIDTIVDAAQEGAGEIYAAVYSTSRKALTKLSQINQPDSIDPDDTRQLSVDSTKQGTFKISVHQDTETFQTDNYGKQFHPYRVTFLPPLDSEDRPTGQPPQLLPLPSGARAAT